MVLLFLISVMWENMWNSFQIKHLYSFKSGKGGHQLIIHTIVSCTTFSCRKVYADTLYIYKPICWLREIRGHTAFNQDQLRMKHRASACIFTLFFQNKSFLFICLWKPNKICWIVSFVLIVYSIVERSVFLTWDGHELRVLGVNGVQPNGSDKGALLTVRNYQAPEDEEVFMGDEEKYWNRIRICSSKIWLCSWVTWVLQDCFRSIGYQGHSIRFRK